MSYDEFLIIDVEEPLNYYGDSELGKVRARKFCDLLSEQKIDLLTGILSDLNREKGRIRKLFHQALARYGYFTFNEIKEKKEIIIADSEPIWYWKNCQLHILDDDTIEDFVKTKNQYLYISTSLNPKSKLYSKIENFKKKLEQKKRKLELQKKQKQVEKAKKILEEQGIKV